MVHIHFFPPNNDFSTLLVQQSKIDFNFRQQLSIENQDSQLKSLFDHRNSFSYYFGFESEVNCTKIVLKACILPHNLPIYLGNNPKMHRIAYAMPTIFQQ